MRLRNSLVQFKVRWDQPEVRPSNRVGVQQGWEILATGLCRHWSAEGWKRKREPLVLPQHPIFTYTDANRFWVRREARTEQANGVRAIAVGGPNRRCHVNEPFGNDGLAPITATFFLGGGAERRLACGFADSQPAADGAERPLPRLWRCEDASSWLGSRF